jgi:leucyl/phenylalanyl-tRNA---protein transferase
MPLFILEKDFSFPPVHLAEPDGLLAVGGDLSIDRLLVAYSKGIFPWYEGRHILWWCPDPRFVLFPNELRISKSMKKLIKQEAFNFTTDVAFEQVINNCKSISRKGQAGTWITNEVRRAYIQLHKNGFAHSAEVWKDGELAGGLYGVRLGKIFFGESMFSRQNNASKYAFIKFIEYLRNDGVELIDCQIHTEHLETFGARMIPRNEFIHTLKKLLPVNGLVH